MSTRPPVSAVTGAEDAATPSLLPPAATGESGAPAASPLHVVYVIDSLAAGGAERSLVALAPHLVTRGIELEVACLRGGGALEAQLVDAGVPLHVLRHGAGRWGWLWQTRRLLARCRPDLVHTTLFEADVVGRLAARSLRIPVVSSLVNDAYGDEQRSTPGVRAWRLHAARGVDAATTRLVCRFHAISATVASSMAARLGIPPDRIEVIPRGRDLRELGRPDPSRRDRVRMALGMAPDVPLILAASRHEYQKGLDQLIVALGPVVQALPDARLLIAGREGSATTDLRRTVRELRLDTHVALLGHRDDVADLLCAADLLVQPSRWEGLGGTLLEAMALGTPIVASDLPAVREAVGDLALLVPSDDPARLADAIVSALTTRGKAQELAHQARRRFLRRFRIEPVADATVGFYWRALQAAGRRARPSATLASG